MSTLILLEDKTPLEQMTELRTLHAELRMREQVQTMLRARIAFLKEILKPHHTQPELEYWCKEDGCMAVVTHTVSIQGDEYDGGSDHYFTCIKHKRRGNSITGVSVEALQT